MRTINILKLTGSISICLITAGIGLIFTIDAIPNWYANLEKPVFNPPNWIFGPVWTTLYFLMGVSLFLVWNKNPKDAQVRKGIILFFIQLALNLLWSVIFFGLKLPSLALIEIIVLWIMIYQTFIQFKKISKPAAWMLIPYLAWVSFAAILNAFIVLLNF